MRKLLKILLYIFIVIIIFSIISFSKEWMSQTPQNIIKSLSKKDISEMEKLTYRLNLIGMIPLGEAIVQDRGLINFKGEDLRYFHGMAKARGFFSILGLKAECELQSYVEPANFNVRLFREKTELSFKEPEIKEIVYDQDAHVMDGPEGRYAILPDTKDLLSLCFYFKDQRFELDNTFKIYLNTNQKNYALDIKVLDKKSIDVNGEDFTVWVLDCLLERHDRSGSEHGANFKIWVLEDYDNIPIKFEIDTFYSFFAAYLIDAD